MCFDHDARPRSRRSLEQVEGFEQALADTGVEHDIHVYPGAPA